MQTIGRYKILEEVGRGAMGVVYKAQDPAIGRVVAIKTIRLGEFADTAERAKLRERLRREAQSAGVLSHPGIVTIYDVAEEGELAYISMEFVDGPTLDSMVVNNPPDAKLVISILTQTAAALDFAHKRGIVHRDIKPSNIMMHEGTTAKITDFGVARVQSHQMTQAGSMIGTPNYMSPEHISGQSVDGRSDQFSLGVIAYELLTGEKPFAADSIPALVFRIVREDPAPIQNLNATLTWTADTVVKRALSKNPDDRYPTCSDFIFALENACRASKGWKPIAPGVLQDLPTITPERKTAPVGAPPPLERSTPLQDEDAVPAERTPTALKYARALALLIVGACIIIGIILGALRLFTSEPERETAVVQDETQRPAAPPKDPGTPGRSLPGDQGSQDTRPAPSERSSIPIERSGEGRTTRSEAINETRLVTSPPGAQLTIDGANDCVSPCSVELKPGRHTLAAVLEGHRKTLRIFNTPADQEIFINLERTAGTVMIRSDPNGASILVNGQPRSEKTPAVLKLPTGRYTVEVVHEGDRESQEVVVQDSTIANLAFNFR